MPQFRIVNESTEDTLEISDSLPEAMRVTRELARRWTATSIH